MKIKIITLSALVSIGLIVGCSGGSSKESAPKAESTTTTTLARTTTTTVYSALDSYVSSAKTRLPGATRAELIEIGQQSCTVIRAFGSVELAIIGIASDPTWTTEAAKTAGYIMGLAIPLFCPEYTAEAQRISA
jgi:ABC-type glycerol-3-phosphate transport system substrate-binding protein